MLSLTKRNTSSYGLLKTEERLNSIRESISQRPQSFIVFALHFFRRFQDTLCQICQATSATSVKQQICHAYVPMTSPSVVSAFESLLSCSTLMFASWLPLAGLPKNVVTRQGYNVSCKQPAISNCTVAGQLTSFCRHFFSWKNACKAPGFRVSYSLTAYVL